MKSFYGARRVRRHEESAAVPQSQSSAWHEAAHACFCHSARMPIAKVIAPVKLSRGLTPAELRSTIN